MAYIRFKLHVNGLQTQTSATSRTNQNIWLADCVLEESNTRFCRWNF